MSPPCMIELQNKLGGNHDSMLLSWKKALEKNLLALKLMEELKKKQLQDFQENDIIIIIFI